GGAVEAEEIGVVVIVTPVAGGEEVDTPAWHQLVTGLQADFRLVIVLEALTADSATSLRRDDGVPIAVAIEIGIETERQPVELLLAGQIRGRVRVLDRCLRPWNVVRRKERQMADGIAGAGKEPRVVIDIEAPV